MAIHNEYQMMMLHKDLFNFSEAFHKSEKCKYHKNEKANCTFEILPLRIKTSFLGTSQRAGSLSGHFQSYHLTLLLFAGYNTLIAQFSLTCPSIPPFAHNLISESSNCLVEFSREVHFPSTLSSLQPLHHEVKLPHFLVFQT